MLKEKNSIFNFTDSGIHLNFTTRKFPVIKSEEKYNDLINSVFPKGKNIYVTKQIHSSIVNIVRGKGFYIGDGLITDKIGDVLSIFTADCYPIMIYSTTPPILALIHAGWRGTYKRIIKNTVEILDSHYSCNKLKAFIGPGICEKCYEVGEEMKDYFPDKYFSSKGESLKLNLKSVISDKLKENGIESIFDSNFCTVCNNDLFFSYRAENKTKNRILTFAYISKTSRE